MHSPNLLSTRSGTRASSSRSHTTSEHFAPCSCSPVCSSLCVCVSSLCVCPDNSILQTVVNFFDCVQVTEGVSVLSVIPSVRCEVRVYRVVHSHIRLPRMRHTSDSFPCSICSASLSLPAARLSFCSRSFTTTALGVSAMKSSTCDMEFCMFHPVLCVLLHVAVSQI